ncbi:hypothetical protein HJD18_12610 [Thermoleophilia bacterium SCSIO 60948]|nr:hypothetical protein HJD18_12610 [Thermoleophilia bacterium SCSIO 60948]
MEGFGTLATPHTAATEAGSRVFADGGNALDAAVCAAAVLGVAFPHMCAIGGDVIAIVRGPDGSSTVLNASGPVPLGARRPEGHSMPLTGPETITVPGALAGLRVVHRAGGAMEFGALLGPAVGLATGGVAVAPSLARSIRNHAADIRADPGLAAVLAPGGSPLAEGDELRQPALGATLETLARDGVESFYGGALGRRFCAGLAGHGAALQPSDLERFEVEAAEPLRTEWRGLRVSTAPPNSQGVSLLQILGGLGGDDDPVAVARLFAAAARDRDRWLADPAFEDVPVERLLAPEYLAEMRNPSAPGEPSAAPDGDTVAVCAVDRDGRAVSLIMSVFHAFGAALLEPDTGILCHNRGASFSLDPASPNRWEPGKRPAHTLMPVLAEGDGLVAAHGTMGGRAQPQIHAQLLLARDRGLSASEIVGAPRFVVGELDQGGRGDVVRAEQDLDPDTRHALEASGLSFEELAPRSDDVGHAQIAELSGARLDAGTDPRADG